MWRTVAPLVMAAALGCAGEYRVIRQAPANPLAGATRFVGESGDFDGTTVQGGWVAAWLTERAPEQRASVQKDKEAVGEHFATRMQKNPYGLSVRSGQPRSDEVVVRPTVRQLKLGSFGASLVLGGKAEMEMTVELIDSA